mgnify:CR=1 FL=1
MEAKGRATSRRNFLKLGGISALGALSAGALSACGYQEYTPYADGAVGVAGNGSTTANGLPSFMQAPEPIAKVAETVDCDVLVIGAGAAGMLLAFFSVGGLAHGLMTGELTGALATPLSWVPLAWPARLGSLGVEAFIDAARAAGPLLTTALAGLVLTLAADAVLLAWFCRFEDGRADA